MAYLVETDRVCDVCRSRRATLELRTKRNEKVGLCCRQCSTRWLGQLMDAEDRERSGGDVAGG